MFSVLKSRNIELIFILEISQRISVIRIYPNTKRVIIIHTMPDFSNYRGPK